MNMPGQLNVTLYEEAGEQQCSLWPHSAAHFPPLQESSITSRPTNCASSSDLTPTPFRLIYINLVLDFPKKAAQLLMNPSLRGVQDKPIASRDLKSLCQMLLRTTQTGGRLYMSVNRRTTAPHDTVYSHDDEDNTLFAPTTYGVMNGFAHIYEYATQSPWHIMIVFTISFRTKQFPSRPRKE